MLKANYYIAGFCLVGIASILAIDHYRAPEVVVWDFSVTRQASFVGWTPKDYLDLMYSRDGDFDFTLISGVGKYHRVFHQRCFSIGCGRSHGLDISFIFAHFGKNITLEDAIPLVTKVLTKWGGGVADPPPSGELSLPEFCEKIKKGTYYEVQYRVGGKKGGVVTISLTGHEGRAAGMHRRCTLTFSP